MSLWIPVFWFVASVHHPHDVQHRLLLVEELVNDIWSDFSAWKDEVWPWNFDILRNWVSGEIEEAEVESLSCEVLERILELRDRWIAQEINLTIRPARKLCDANRREIRGVVSVGVCVQEDHARTLNIDRNPGPSNQAHITRQLLEVAERVAAHANNGWGKNNGR